MERNTVEHHFQLPETMWPAWDRASLHIAIADHIEKETENRQSAVSSFVGDVFGIYVQHLLNANNRDYQRDLPDDELARVVMQDIQNTTENDDYDADADRPIGTVLPAEQSEILVKAIAVCECLNSVNYS